MRAGGVADGVHKELEALRRDLSPDARLSLLYDQSLLVTESAGGVRESILFGLLLSVAIVVAFLKHGQRWAATAGTAAVAVVVIPVAEHPRAGLARDRDAGEDRRGVEVGATAPLLRHRGAERAEVVGCEVIDQPIRAEVTDAEVGPFLILGE
jgi:hypothetical protein